jgi:hypothetical protein
MKSERILAHTLYVEGILPYTPVSTTDLKTMDTVLLHTPKETVQALNLSLVISMCHVRISAGAPIHLTKFHGISQSFKMNAFMKDLRFSRR